MRILIRKTMRGLLRLVDDGAGRYSMAGVAVIAQAGDAPAWLVATNGKVAGIARDLSPDDPDAFIAHNLKTGTLPEPRVSGVRLQPIVVPADTFGQAVKAVPKKADRFALVTDGERLGVLQPGGALATDNVLEGRFPDVESVLPKGPPLVTVHLNPAYLIALLQAAMEVTGDSAQAKNGGPRVALRYYGKDKPVGVTAHSPDVTFDGMIMPLT